MPDEFDELRISKTIAFLLRHRPDVGNLHPDEQGWVSIEELSVAVSRLMRLDIESGRVEALVRSARVSRFEIRDDRIRAVQRAPARRGVAPDILYHATTAEQVEQYLAEGRVLPLRGRGVYLSEEESQAWRAAHRLGGSPRVLFVDTGRARRRGVPFARNRRNGLYVAPELPLNAVLNLLPRFAEQWSAGGIPVQWAPDGTPLMALARVTRRSGRTWEIAKGKLEEGEPPEWAAVREVREEMGIEVGLSIFAFVGLVRYGFLAPGSLPRLKTVHLYLMKPDEPIGTDFRPALREGIGEVRWFTPDQACRAVTHSSLVPLMRQARRMLLRR